MIKYLEQRSEKKRSLFTYRICTTITTTSIVSFAHYSPTTISICMYLFLANFEEIFFAILYA